MKNKKNRLFKILFFPISLMLCLSIFLINSFAQNGYNIDSNGDIQSLNVLDINSYTSERVNVSINGLEVSISVNNDVWAYIEYEILPSIQYTISFDSVGSGKVVYSDNGNSLYNIDFATGHFARTFTSDARYLRFYVSWGSAETKTTILSNIMLSKGNVELDYFPYGFYSSTSLNPFSPDNIRLIDFLGYGGAYNWTELPKENAYQYFSVQSLQIERFLNANNINEYNTNYGRTGIEIDLINPIDLSGYHYLFNFSTDSYSGTPPNDFYIGFSRYNSTNNFIVYYTQQESTQYQSSFTIDLPSDFLCDGISVFWYNVDTNRNILSQITLGSYDLGYNNGVKSGMHLGYNDGYNNGYSVGETSGFQRGYNDGINSNLETNGIRTLFNSILSFPVDMIKSVFNFEFMGVNIASVITFIISIGIVAFVLKKFL